MLHHPHLQVSEEAQIPQDHLDRFRCCQQMWSLAHTWCHCLSCFLRLKTE